MWTVKFFSTGRLLPLNRDARIGLGAGMAVDAITPLSPTREGLSRSALPHGVTTYRHAVRLHGESYVRAQLMARRWQSPTDAIVVQHNGPLTGDQRMWVSLLAAPSGTVVGGLSAAILDGLTGFKADALHLVVPGSSRDLRQHRHVLVADFGVALRWSRVLGPEDVRQAANPPRTRIARSIVDAASERVGPRRSRVLVLAAVQQGRTKPPALWDALSRRGRCRNRAVITESIADAAGGIESLPEHEFASLCRRLRLPEPTRQRVLRRTDGRYFLDAEWEEFGVRAEIHGIPHMFVRNWDQDLLRQNDLSIGGEGLLVFSSYAIRHLQDRVGSQLVQMLRRRGYRGPG
jgi:hypothetical protein